VRRGIGTALSRKTTERFLGAFRHPCGVAMFPEGVGIIQTWWPAAGISCSIFLVLTQR
jgi:hypothetical protein